MLPLVLGLWVGALSPLPTSLFLYGFLTCLPKRLLTREEAPDFPLDSDAPPFRGQPMDSSTTLTPASSSRSPSSLSFSTFRHLFCVVNKANEVPIPQTSILPQRGRHRPKQINKVNADCGPHLGGRGWNTTSMPSRRNVCHLLSLSKASHAHAQLSSLVLLRPTQSKAFSPFPPSTALPQHPLLPLFEPLSHVLSLN